jgi:hypothetical protein
MRLRKTLRMERLYSPKRSQRFRRELRVQTGPNTSAVSGEFQIYALVREERILA